MSNTVNFCSSCGTKLDPNAKFCKGCGLPVSADNSNAQRQQEFAGKIYKCPSCGEILKSFEINCPVCGYELRDTKVSSAVKEFALKLETIESKREYEKPRGIFETSETLTRITKTDEQKISLIKSFSVPNSKEDMLEFMILATSSMNMKTYDSSNTSVSKSEKEITEAWFSKVQQVYEKAKRCYLTDETFIEIKDLYDKCNDEIRKRKKIGVIKCICMFGWIPLFLIITFVSIVISSPKDEAKEIERLENIVIEVQTALENGEFKHALRIADSIDYKRSNEEMKRKWVIEREYWIDKVIEEAEKNGVNLERPEDKPNENESSNETDTSGFISGFKKGVQPGIDSIKENIDEFNRIINEEDEDKQN